MSVNEYDTMYLDQLLLPDYGELREITQPNVSKNYTLNGELYVDYFNNRRMWELRWNFLTPAQYDAIRAKYDKQFSQDTMLMFIVNNRGLFVPVYMSISEKVPKWNGQQIVDFSITLEEQYAIS